MIRNRLSKTRRRRRGVGLDRSRANSGKVGEKEFITCNGGGGIGRETVYIYIFRGEGYLFKFIVI